MCSHLHSPWNVLHSSIEDDEDPNNMKTGREKEGHVFYNLQLLFVLHFRI